MALLDPYQTLEISPQASPDQIKQAYRKLAKQYHPDRNPDRDTHAAITAINAAYELLSDPQRRSTYDRQRQGGLSDQDIRDRVDRTAAAQARYRRRATGKAHDDALDQWLKSVYRPLDRQVREIMKPLRQEINALSGDPFDDDLMAAFETYLERSRTLLDRGRSLLRSHPNPPSAAAAAAHLYYCLDRLEDGLDEMGYFPLNYDDSRLNDGRELFRIAEGLRRDARDAIRDLDLARSR
jgi:molecular chaperone DnaJ